ncbi:MAG: DUF1559 domain-containing protein [Planctomycetia bacterium]|nr:DUF1559 domain-containing protein [Planctomycetia bacterium]
MHVTFRSRFAACGLLVMLAAVVAAVGPFTPPQSVVAQPNAPQIPTELKYVPTDAALFVYADAAAIWKSDLAKTLRAADKEIFGALETQAVKMFGSKIDELKSVVFFIPKLKMPADAQKLGIVLTFTKAIDKDKLTEGLTNLLPKDAKPKVLTPSEKVAVVLVGLGEEYGKPQAADEDGALWPAIKAAASGKHTLVAGSALGSLPDALRNEELPGLRDFQPIFKSESIFATLDLGKSLTLDVRVKAKTEARALDAEKSLGAFAKIITDELNRELPKLEKEAVKDPMMKDLVKVFTALLDAVKGAKFEVDGNVARVTASIPISDLPIASAYLAGVVKARQAAASAQSANNLKQIALAMHNYYDSLGNFPPAAVCDKDGKPMLSWRVLILPYIEQDALYKQFKLDEPWDSDNNKKLIEKMPKVYAMPGNGKLGDATHYRVFVGNGAGFDWLMGTKINQIADGSSNTFMCVTAAEAVPWTKPDELAFDPDKDMAKLLGPVVNGRVQVAMFDGCVRTLSKIPAKETLNALITKNGGEVIGPDFR